MKETMSATAFKRWLKHMDYNHSKAARELGVSRPSVLKYIEEGAPKHIRLACAYLTSMKDANGGRAWPPEEKLLRAIFRKGK